MSPDDPLDAAIRAHLDSESRKIDAVRVLAGVRARQSRPVILRRTFRWATFGAAAVAACLLVGLFLTGNTPAPGKTATAMPSAAELVQEAKSVYETTVTDRCYQVQADWDLKPGMPRIPATRSATVWTRGDQFVVLSAVEDGPPWAWGQEADGRVWLAPNKLHAVVFDKDELNDPLARFCELMSLRMVTTLGEVLEKYDLFRQDNGEPGEPIRIGARLRPGTVPLVRIRQVELVLDPVTKVVQSAVLHRYAAGVYEGKISFILTGTDTQPSDFYTLDGHTLPRRVIHDGKPVLPQSNPRVKIREELLKKWQTKGKERANEPR